MVKNRKEHDKNKTIFLWATLIIAFGFAIYFNSLNCQFFWDDEFLVKDNIYIKSWSNMKSIFTKDIGSGGGIQYSSYRPIQMFTYMIDYSLWGLNVRGYHLTNILLHILAGLAMFSFINLLFNNFTVSLFSSILFLVHPIHTEAVTYISGRADILAALFVYLTLILYIKAIHSKNNNLTFLGSGAYLLAILSKEYSLILPLLLLLCHSFFKIRVKFKHFLPILTITLLYVLFRLTVLSSITPQQELLPYTFQRLPGVFVAIANYIKLLIFPFNLHMEYGYRLFGFFDFRAALGILAIILLLTVAFLKARRNKLISFAIFWFFIALLPNTNLYPINAYMAEHWLYMPSLGFFLGIAYGINYLYRIRNLKTLAALIFVSLTVFYSFLTIRQNNYWKDPVLFYKRTLKYTPNSVRVLVNLANIYRETGKTQEALTLYKKAIEINPNCHKVYLYLGVISTDANKDEEAISLYKKAIEINPRYAKAYNNLGNIYNKLAKPEEAMVFYKKAIEINPEYADAYYNLGNLYSSIGNIEQAIAFYKKAIGISPDYIDAYNNLALLFQDIGNMDDAINFYRKVIKLNPRYSKAYNNLGNIYYRKGRMQESVVFYRKSIEIDPNDAQVYNNLGIVLYASSDIKEESLDLFKKAIEIDPTNADAHNNLAVAYYYKKQYDLAIKHCDLAIKLGYKVDSHFLKLLEPFRK